MTEEKLDPRVKPEHFTGRTTGMSRNGLLYQTIFDDARRRASVSNFGDARDGRTLRLLNERSGSASCTVAIMGENGATQAVGSSIGSQDRILKAFEGPVESRLADEAWTRWEHSKHEEMEGQSASLVAMVGGEAVGCTDVEMGFTRRKDGSVWTLWFYLHDVYVKGSKRGLGYGMDLSFSCGDVLADMILVMNQIAGAEASLVVEIIVKGAEEMRSAPWIVGYLEARAADTIRSIVAKDATRRIDLDVTAGNLCWTSIRGAGVEMLYDGPCISEDGRWVQPTPFPEDMEWIASLGRDRVESEAMNQDFSLLDTYAGGEVSQQLLELALDFMVSLEPGANDPDGMEVYEARLAVNAERLGQAEGVLRAYGEAIKPRTLEAMHSTFYAITNSDKYRRSAEACSCVSESLRGAWNGIGPWES